MVTSFVRLFVSLLDPFFVKIVPFLAYGCAWSHYIIMYANNGQFLVKTKIIRGWRSTLFETLLRIYVIRLGFILGNLRFKAGIASRWTQWRQAETAFQQLLGDDQCQTLMRGIFGKKIPEPLKSLLEGKTPF